MKTMNCFLILAAIIFLGGCDGSSSSKSDGPLKPQASIRLNSFPDDNSQQLVLINEFPLGEYLLQSITYTLAYPTSDISYQHNAKTLGIFTDGDEVIVERTLGEYANNFGISFPFEIHSNDSEVQFIDSRYYSAGFDTDDSWSWEYNEKGGTLYSDIAKRIEIAPAANSKIYVNKQDESFFAIQVSSDTIIITLKTETASMNGKQIYQLKYKKGESLSATPVSTIFKK